MLFKKKIKKAFLTNTMQLSAITKVAQLLLQIQLIFARFMNKLVEKMSPRRLKIMLTVFCLAGAGLSIYIMVTALSSEYPYVIHQHHIQTLLTDTTKSLNKK